MLCVQSYTLQRAQSTLCLHGGDKPVCVRHQATPLVCAFSEYISAASTVRVWVHCCKHITRVHNCVYIFRVHHCCISIARVWVHWSLQCVYVTRVHNLCVHFQSTPLCTYCQSTMMMIIMILMVTKMMMTTLMTTVIMMKMTDQRWSPVLPHWQPHRLLSHHRCGSHWNHTHIYMKP